MVADLPTNHCQEIKTYAEEIMVTIIKADLSKIKATHNKYKNGKQSGVIREALKNATSVKPITVNQFGLKMYKRCLYD